MPKQLGPNRSLKHGFLISVYRMKGLLISDMLEASLPEPSLASWFPLSSQGIRHQNNVFYVFPLPPSPLLLCQMTNAHLTTDTPYQ